MNIEDMRKLVREMSEGDILVASPEFYRSLVASRALEQEAIEATGHFGIQVRISETMEPGTATLIPRAAGFAVAPMFAPGQAPPHEGKPGRILQFLSRSGPVPQSMVGKKVTGVAPPAPPSPPKPEPGPPPRVIRPRRRIIDM